MDTDKARKIAGVVDIVTCKDEDIKNLSAGGGFMGPALPFLDNIADQEGTEVAVVVVAENEDICEEALRRLDLKWEVLPHVVDLIEGRTWMREALEKNKLRSIYDRVARRPKGQLSSQNVDPNTWQPGVLSPGAVI